MQISNNGFLSNVDDKDLEILKNNPDKFWDGVTGILSFRGNDNLQSITIPGSVKEIYWEAFGYCENLKEIILEKGIEKIDVQAFDGCTGLEKVVLPDGLKYIYAQAFNGCTNLKEVVIPANMKVVGDSLFTGCKKLQKVTFKDKNSLPKNIQNVLSGFSFDSFEINGDKVTFIREIQNAKINEDEENI